MKSAILFCLWASFAIAQGPAPVTVASEWDVRKMLESLDLQGKHLRPIMDQLKPETWAAKGAPATYAAQWKSGQAQLNYFLASNEALLSQPERLTLALETYFRMQSLDYVLGSLAEGARKYQDPALAEAIQSAVAENGVNRDRLRQYVQDLAAQKEQEFKIADSEAQRCRVTLFQQAAPKERKSTRP